MIISLDFVLFCALVLTGTVARDRPRVATQMRETSFHGRDVFFLQHNGFLS